MINLSVFFAVGAFPYLLYYLYPPLPERGHGVTGRWFTLSGLIMYYLLCDICCHEMLQEKRLCQVDGNVFKGYLQAVKWQVFYSFKCLELHMMTFSFELCVKICLEVQMRRVNGWSFVLLFVVTYRLFIVCEIT